MNASGFRWRRLSHSQDVEIRRAIAGGASVRALAEAYSCSTRTIQRARARALERAPVQVTLGDHAAHFAITEDGPVQVGPWLPREAA